MLATNVTFEVWREVDVKGLWTPSFIWGPPSGCYLARGKSECGGDMHSVNASVGGRGSLPCRNIWHDTEDTVTHIYTGLGGSHA